MISGIRALLRAQRHVGPITRPYRPYQFARRVTIQHGPTESSEKSSLRTDFSSTAGQVDNEVRPETAEPCPKYDLEEHRLEEDTADLISMNHKRNLAHRELWKTVKVTSENFQSTRVQKALKSPFVPHEKKYPSPAMRRKSEKDQYQALTQVLGSDAVWAKALTDRHGHEKHALMNEPTYEQILAELKGHGRSAAQRQQLTALRLRLPESYRLTLPDHRKVSYVDPVSGLGTKISTSAYFKGKSTIVLRGYSKVLARAADEIIRAVPGVEVFELGEVADIDFSVKQLWPRTRTNSEDEADAEAMGTEQIWVHEEQEDVDISIRYEDLPRPVTWTSETLFTYISTIVHSSLHPDLANDLYNDPKMDMQSPRVQLIDETLRDPKVVPHITAPILQMALNFMGNAGFHRARANELFMWAETTGLPVDVEIYNLMLSHYVKIRESRWFYRILRRMNNRFIKPDAQTWILYMRLLQKTEDRNTLAVAMWEEGLMKTANVRRSVASVMARQDAYEAFRGRMKLSRFLDSQAARYGEDWYTTNAMRNILDEYLAWNEKTVRKDKANDILLLFRRQSSDGEVVLTSDINKVIKHARFTKDWNLACWALTLFDKFDCKADYKTYEQMIKIAEEQSLPRALGVFIFYAILERKLKHGGRRTLSEIITGSTGNDYWQTHQPFLLPKKIKGRLRFTSAAGGFGHIRFTERFILDNYRGFEPAASISSLAKLLLLLDKNGTEEGHTAVISLREINQPTGPIERVVLNDAFPPRPAKERINRPTPPLEKETPANNINAEETPSQEVTPEHTEVEDVMASMRR